jgi:hypothetical protein
MKKRFAFSFSVLTLLLLACPSLTLPGLPFLSPASEQTVAPTTEPWVDRSLFSDGLIQADRSVLEGLDGATFYGIELTIATDFFHVSGRETVHYTNRSTDLLTEIQMRLYPNLLGGQLAIATVTADDRTLARSIDMGNSVLHIQLASPLQPGQSVTLQIGFSVQVPTDIHTNYGILAYSGGVLSLAHSYPMVSVYGPKGWNEEIPSPWGDVLFNDTCFYIVHVDAPAQLVLAATGREVQHISSGDRQQVTYADGPARDFYLAASADYAMTSQTVGEVTLNSYAPRGDDIQSQRALDTAAAALQDFSSRYAPYPYTEFDIVAIPTGALGIEYPGLVAILIDLYAAPPAGDSQSAQTIEFTVAHETGHQWFYNLVGNNQLDEPWLDESLTQFATWQYFYDRYGAAVAATFKQQSLMGDWDSIQDAVIPIGKPVSAYTGDEYVGIIYGRGPLFFLALEQQLGQKTYGQFLRDYVAKYSWDIATTEGLKQLAEQDCGCDLTPLFNQWITP